jgi:hypothetical protein
MIRHVKIGELTIGNDLPYVLIAGPCQIESRAHALETAAALREICVARGLGLIYRAWAGMAAKAAQSPSMQTVRRIMTSSLAAPGRRYCRHPGRQYVAIGSPRKLAGAAKPRAGARQLRAFLSDPKIFATSARECSRRRRNVGIS